MSRVIQFRSRGRVRSAMKSTGILMRARSCPRPRRLQRRRADRHLHRKQLRCRDAGVFDAAVAERHVDALRHWVDHRPSGNSSMTMCGQAPAHFFPDDRAVRAEVQDEHP
ncbi:hypothetical protein [Burkholderia anthina]|uniref:hypothetical protein n=1 Tax=Burkholderia anthina TaxID=179879 RepID=UPI00158E28D7|nr:hypothetical protein [Burkholderia anthina]